MKFIRSILLPAQLFLITPLSLFLANSDEMKADFFAVLKLALVPFLTCSLLLFFLFRFLPRGLSRLLQISVVAVTALVWMQSSLIAWDYGVLDGQPIDWSSYPLRGWIDAATWAIVGGVVVFLANRRTGSSTRFLATLIVLQATLITAQAAYNPDVFTAEEKFDSPEDLDALSHFSPDANVLHLVIDGFQSDVLGYLVNQSEIGERYQKGLSGFTFYPETLGVFPFTRFSVPAFLSGEIYRNDVPKSQFVSRVLSGSNLLNQSREQGYDLDIAGAGRYWITSYANAKTTNIYGLDNLTLSNPEHLQTAMLVDLAIFRSLPHFLKRFAYNDQDWLVSKAVRKSGGIRHWYFLHTLFLNKIAERLQVDRARPVYKYFHVMNTHNPMVVDAQCHYLGEIVPMTRTSLTYQTKCTMDTLTNLFDSMRSHGVYDNTLIIIHGDHGGWTHNLRKGPVPRFSDGTALGWEFASLASPLLAIKPVAADTPFQESRKLVSLLQLPDTIRSELRWPGDYGFQPIADQLPDATPSRKFYFYQWQRDAWETDFTGPIYEFDITGSHYDTEWQHIGTIPPPD